MTMELLKHPLTGNVDVAEAFVALYGDAPHALWWDDHGERGRGVSYIASGTLVPAAGRPWREVLRSAHASLPQLASGNLGSLPLGVVMVLPYELAQDTLALGETDADPIVLVVDRLVASEQRTLSATLYALGDSWSGELGLWRDETIQRVVEATSLPQPSLPDAPVISWRDSTARYRDMIQQARASITEGDAYQLCLTTSLEVQAAIDPLSLHRVIRETNPTHHQALIRSGDISLVSASPETFLDVSAQGIVTTRPIKGTRPRGATPEDDARLANELRSSDKEQAENLMIVDLMRNDLSVACEVGSVAVPELMALESYASVHQLVSTITGTLRVGADLVDVLDATFPAGSMTGAPKRRAVQLLAAWEQAPRGYYSGVFGVWRADSSATLAMTIRTAVIDATSTRIGVGGGITALSEPSSEIAEVGIKAMPFLRALGHAQVDYS
jgi:anthranilate/para-aminobenzoate synthase component I